MAIPKYYEFFPPIMEKFIILKKFEITV